MTLHRSFRIDAKRTNQKDAHDEAEEVAYDEAMASYRAEHDVWSEINRAIVGDIARQTRKSGQES